MTQTKTDSLMEAFCNVALGLIVSTICNFIILPLTLGITPTLGQNLLIGLLYTIVSVTRSYALRRLFNGRSVWTTIKTSWIARLVKVSA